MKQIRLLIIGASGYLGSAIFQSKLFSNKIGTYYNNQLPGLFYLNLSDKQLLINFIKQHQPDLILYAAGQTNVDFCQTNPDIALYLNYEVIKLITNISNAKFVYYSTDYVFDGLSGNYTEESVPNPVNVYGYSKLQGEYAVLQANENNLVIRVSGLYGFSNSSNTRFLKEIESKEIIYAEDNRISSPISLGDVCEVTKLLLEKNANGIFHAAGNALSRYEYQQLLSFYSKNNNFVIPTYYHNQNDRTPRPLNTSLKTNKLNKLNWKSKSIPLVLKETFNVNAKSENFQHDLFNEIVKQNKKVILFDCVGAILSKREWIEQTDETNKFDILLGSGLSEFEIKNILSITDCRDFEERIKAIASFYTINPILWNLLPYFKRNNYKIVIVNNGLSKTFRYWVEKYGFLQIFDLLVNSEEIGFKKPQMEFFNYCTKALQCTIDDCLLIDDNFEIIYGAQKNDVKTLQTNEIKKFPVSEYIIKTN